MAKPNDILGEVAEVSAASDAPLADPRFRRDLNSHAKARDNDRTRRMEAMSLRLAGMTFEQITDRLGLPSVEAAKALINRTLERAENSAVDQMRSTENARLDRAQAAIWSKVLEGDTKAVDTFLRLSHRRAKLNGLDEPTRVDLSVTVRQEMTEALATLEAVVLEGGVFDVTDAPE